MKKVLLACFAALGLLASLSFKAYCMDNNRQLFYEVRANDPEAVDQLFTKDPNLNPNYIYNETGQSLLNLAASKGHTKIVQNLLKHGANVNIQGEALDTPLYSASAYGCIETVAELLKAGASSNIVNKYGNTPLAIAAAYGYEDVVRMLLDHGAEIHAQGSNGETALHKATINAHSNVVALLLSKNADMYLQNKQGKSALDLIEERYHMQEFLELIELFFKAKRQHSAD